VFAKEDGFWVAVLEADEGVFPVTDMIPKADVQNFVAQVKAVEEEPESIDDSIAFIHRN
jgi:hypothetical protein